MHPCAPHDAVKALIGSQLCGRQLVPQLMQAALGMLQLLLGGRMVLSTQHISCLARLMRILLSCRQSIGIQPLP